MKISFHLYANKTYFHMKSFALSHASIMRLDATRNWPASRSKELCTVCHFMTFYYKAGAYRLDYKLSNYNTLECDRVFLFLFV